MMNLDKHFEKIEKTTWYSYENILKKNMKTWDFIVLTSSSKKQAKLYKNIINDKLKKRQLPKSKYIIIEDKNGKRIGSGGATLNVFKELNKKYGSLKDKKILIINSGGDSKRVPQYSNIGKIFSPVQRILPNGSPSTLFDENIIFSMQLCRNIKNGCLIISGDVRTVFSLNNVKTFDNDIVCITIPTSVEKGINHGVLILDKDKTVKKFLHKKSIETLKKENAIEENNKVNIDTGIIFFSYKIINDLLNGTKEDRKFISDSTRLNLYNDFLIPCTEYKNKEEYLNSEGEIELNKNILYCRNILWNILSKYKIQAIKATPAKFIHYGTTKELLEILYNSNNKKINTNIKTTINYFIYNSYIDYNVNINNNAYIENSIILGNTKIGEKTIISNVICSNVNIPSNIVLNNVQLDNGNYITRIYGICDNPKNKEQTEVKIFNQSLINFIRKFDISENLIWNSNEKTLWNANLYIESSSIDESIKNSIKLYDIMHSKTDKTEIKKYFMNKRISLEESFNKFNFNYDMKVKKEIEIKIEYDKYINCIKDKKKPRVTNDILKKSEFKKELYNRLILSKDYRVLLYLAEYNKKNQQKLIDLSNYQIRNILRINLNVPNKINLKDEALTKLPIRINFGGGWTDTIPYCIENGGSVFNGAFLLNGEYSIYCKVVKIKRKELIFNSIDLKSKKTINELKEIYVFDNVFAIIKASLIVSEFISLNDKSMDDLFNRINGGLIISTYVKNIPHGSGLGTSSILAACCIKTLYKLKNEKIMLNKINFKTLILEQMINNGGGWQDQIGGLLPGLKLITSNAGKEQTIKVEQIQINKNIESFFNNRLLLIFTGKRRQSGKSVKTIMSEYILSKNQTVLILKEIKKISIKMYNLINNEKFNEFCKEMNNHWELLKSLNNDCVTPEMKRIIRVLDDIIESKMICGAGSGGFIEIIIKEKYTKKEAIKIINNRLQSPAKYYDVTINN